jgi:hypothetical protein
MRYKLIKTSNWSFDYSEIHPNLKGQNNTIITQETTDIFNTTSEDVLKAIMIDELDVPSFEPNEENIKREFGSELSKKSLLQIINFYKYRKIGYYEFLKWFEQEGSSDDAYFHLEIPYEYNHFEILEDNCNEKQLSYYFEIIVEKD